MIKTLTVTELLLGVKFVITTLDEGKKIVVNTKGKNIQPGSIILNLIVNTLIKETNVSTYICINHNCET